MFHFPRRELRPLLTIFIVLSAVTGLVYPLFTTALARSLFPTQAAGSLLMRDGKLAGSQLIGQAFSDPKYFWGRLSATSPMPGNAAASSGSNLAPTNPALVEAAQARIAALRAADPDNAAPVPQDLVTASASGLDPHISEAAAHYQAARIARLRGVPLERIEALIAAHTEQPMPTYIGAPHVKVLLLNHALDADHS